MDNLTKQAILLAAAKGAQAKSEYIYFRLSKGCTSTSQYERLEDELLETLQEKRKLRMKLAALWDKMHPGRRQRYLNG